MTKTHKKGVIKKDELVSAYFVPNNRNEVSGLLLPPHRWRRMDNFEFSRIELVEFLPVNYVSFILCFLPGGTLLPDYKGM